MKNKITEMDLQKCPKCGGPTNTFRHMHAKVWCTKCNYVLRKEGDQTIVQEDKNNIRANMKVKCIGEYDQIAITHSKIYEVVSIETVPGTGKCYRIIDDNNESHRYAPSFFEVVK